MTDEQHPDRGFKVDDRRRFSASGEPRDDAAREETTRPAEPPRQNPQAHPEEHLPPLNFSTFVLSLSTQALFALGEMSTPDGPAAAPEDLGTARQLIDILGILEQKTQGNLDETERALLRNVLYDLRLKYVQRAHGK